MAHRKIDLIDWVEWIDWTEPEDPYYDLEIDIDAAPPPELDMTLDEYAAEQLYFSVEQTAPELIV